MKKIAMAAAAISMAVAGSANAAAPVRAADSMPAATKAVEAPVSRASKASKKEAEIGGASVLIAVLAAAAVIAGIVVATDDDGDSNG
ncbi:hypothetical protein [Qipengyuania gaetbuli]|uniref:hypothetical protein n=1 Tax=Qipengyuania gaetbuli TaxID=266952 RepID=UPI001CD1AEB4|nr:hypothetical protein [Qipengyuania gaetbuli]MCA0908924.1 hypothetical protein [Qipengyuania gaetbuli]